jgi:glycosyltransferase involved in cell wall biosynthesis
VAACLPAWNAEPFIEPVLQSLDAQTYGNLEVVVSVDAADDDTAVVCDAFAAGRTNWRVMHQPVRLGWIDNTNALLQMVHSDYVFFAAHDDILDPSYVSRLVDALEHNSAAVLAFGDMESSQGLETYTELEGVSDRVERARRLLMPQGLWWVAYRGLFRADALTHFGGPAKHAAGEYSADWPWLLRLALLGEFVRVPEPLLFKNRRSRGLTAALIASGTAWSRLSVALGCLRELRRARLPLPVSARLHLERLVLSVVQECFLFRERLWFGARRR